MKVKVCIYSEKTPGAPLNSIMVPIYGDIDSLAGVGPLVVTALNAVTAYLPDTEVITMVESMGIQRMLDLTNLKTYLRENQLVLLITEVTEESTVESGSLIIEVVAPNVGMFPASTTYFNATTQYNMLEIVRDQVSKYQVGDPNIIPSCSIRKLLDAISDLESKGMQIFPQYVDQLEYELSNYGFQMYYIYT